MKNILIILGFSAFLLNCRAFTEFQRDPQLQQVNKTYLPDSELKAETRFELDSSDPFDSLAINEFRRAMPHKLLHACAKMDAFNQVEISTPDTNIEPLKAARSHDLNARLSTSVQAQYLIQRTEKGNFLWELFSSLTLFIIPYKATEEYKVSVKAKITNPKGIHQLELTKKSRQTAWFSIIYFFHMFSSDNVLSASDRIAYDVIDEATRALVVEAGNIK